MEYKKNYTKKDVDELVGWFEERKNQLPKTMQIDDSAYVPDLKLTVDIFCDQANTYYENPTFNGSIRMLYRIKEKLEQEKFHGSFI